MKTNISDYIQVFEKLDELGCGYPEGIAILPENFETATPTTSLVQLAEASTIKTLFRNNDIPHSEIRRKNEKPSYIQNNSFKWIGPTLFIPALLLSENPEMIAIALGVIGNYVTDFFKGRDGDKTAKLNIVVGTPQSENFKLISYEGHIDGIPSLADVVREVSNE